MIKPITPNEAAEKSIKSIPQEVIRAFNDAIVMNLKHGSATVKTEPLIKNIITATGAKRQNIFDNGWLDIEKIFAKAGWDVTYESPDRGESGDSYFVFKKKNK